MKRFFDKVLKTGNCWFWIGGSRGSGYGAIKHKGKVVDAHRFSFTIHNGYIPLGMFVCHKCDHKSCVNPDHLFLGTCSDNNNDAFKKGRMVMIKERMIIKRNKNPKPIKECGLFF